MAISTLTGFRDQIVSMTCLLRGPGPSVRWYEVEAQPVGCEPPHVVFLFHLSIVFMILILNPIFAASCMALGLSRWHVVFQSGLPKQCRIIIARNILTNHFWAKVFWTGTGGSKRVKY